MSPAALALAMTLDAIAGQLDAHCTCALPPGVVTLSERRRAS